MTPKVKVIRRQSRSCVALIFDLDQHLVPRHWFTAQRAGLSAPRRAEGAVRLAARQFSTPNRFAGFLSEKRLVGHEGFLDIGPKRESRRRPQGPDAALRHPRDPDGRRRQSNRCPDIFASLFVAISGTCGLRFGHSPQLTQYDDRGRRATFYTTGMEHSPTSATGTAWECTPWRALTRVEKVR